MKNWYLLVLGIFFLASCKKETVEPPYGVMYKCIGTDTLPDATPFPAMYSPLAPGHAHWMALNTSGELFTYDTLTVPDTNFTKLFTLISLDGDTMRAGTGFRNLFFMQGDTVDLVYVISGPAYRHVYYVGN